MTFAAHARAELGDGKPQAVDEVVRIPSLEFSLSATGEGKGEGRGNEGPGASEGGWGVGELLGSNLRCSIIIETAR
jgi:hypothetical protein